MCGMIFVLVDVNVEGMGMFSGNEGGFFVNEDIIVGVYVLFVGKVFKIFMVMMM